MEYISQTKERKLREKISDTLLPSVTQGLEATGLVFNVHIRPKYTRGYAALQEIKIHYQRSRGNSASKCTQLSASLDALCLELGLFLEHPNKKKEVRGRLVTATIRGIEDYPGNKTRLVYDLLKRAEKTVWHFIDPSGKTQYQPQKEIRKKPR